MIPRGIQMPPAVWAVIEKLATDRGVSIGAVVRSIVNEKLEAQLTRN
jgi:predicted DNA-binding ribbon-helix-helix protein